VGVEVGGVEPVDEFDDRLVGHGDSCQPHDALLLRSVDRTTAAGNAARFEATPERPWR
jgi:hypothetical protein